VNAYHHFTPPGPINVETGTKFVLDLMVNSGTNSVEVAQAYMTFTNNILQVVDIGQPGCVPTNTVAADDTIFDATLQNEVCNSNLPCDFGGRSVPPGSIAFSSGAVNNCPTGCNGDFRVARVAFCATAGGDALLHWQFSPPGPHNRDTQIVDTGSNVVNNPLLYADYVIHVAEPSPTPSPTPATILVGHVIWEGPPPQPSIRQQLPITLTLCVGGSPFEYGATTDSSGFFTVTTTLPPASYNWRAKAQKYLATAGNVLLSTGTTQVEMGLQRAGDLDSTFDNVVGITDFNTLRSVFGQPSSKGDLNNDGVTNITDFNLLRINFGQAGAPPNCP
jgi:hypothetical protein